MTPPRRLRDYTLDQRHQRIDELLNLAADGDLVLNPPYQRGAIWIPEQQRLLIRSAREGIPIGLVYIAEHEVGRYRLIAR